MPSGDLTDKKTIDKCTAEDYKNQMLEFGDGKIGIDIYQMIKARYRILYIRSYEEERVIEYFTYMAMSQGYGLFQWDFSRGLLDSLTKQQVASENSEVHQGDPAAVISHIIDHAKSDAQKLIKKNNKMEKKTTSAEAQIYMLLDFHHFLAGPPVERRLKEFAHLTSLCTIVLIAPTFECPDTLEKELALIDFPYASDNELSMCLDEIIDVIPDKYPQGRITGVECREDLIKSVRGLTLPEAGNAYAKSLVRHKDFHIPTILEEKKQIIRKGGILEYRDSKFTFDDIGGLNVLKEWLQLHKLAFKDDAAEFGLEPPKGVLLVGIPGTGKSMTCDALASCYEMPLLRLDMGAIFGSLVGESENNMRNCLQVAEAVSPCILWIDEIEKGIGNVSSSSGDSGTTKRVFGTFLTWLQDKKAPVFVACTANNVDNMPPEFLRAGRFDEIFFLDLPDADQRYEVTEKLLRKKNRDPKNFDIDAIVEHSKFFTPVEIEKGINNALFVAYADDKRKLMTTDIVIELGKFPPLYNSKREEIEAMREWAIGEHGTGGRAILASSSEAFIENPKSKPELNLSD